MLCGLHLCMVDCRRQVTCRIARDAGRPGDALHALRQGTGKQLRGAVVNLASYYFAAVPLAILLAFSCKQGVEGLYAGLCLGPAIQVNRSA